MGTDTTISTSVDTEVGVEDSGLPSFHMSREPTILGVRAQHAKVIAIVVATLLFVSCENLRLAFRVLSRSMSAHTQATTAHHSLGAEHHGRRAPDEQVDQGCGRLSSHLPDVCVRVRGRRERQRQLLQDGRRHPETGWKRRGRLGHGLCLSERPPVLCERHWWGRHRAVSLFSSLHLADVGVGSDAGSDNLLKRVR